MPPAAEHLSKSQPLSEARLDSEPQFEFMQRSGSVAQGCCIHTVVNTELVMDPHGIIYWPAEKALLVADLHLEKGSSFARKGQMLPPYDTRTTLNRLAHCIEKWQPRLVVAMGDSFHDPFAAARLDGLAVDRLYEMMRGREWIWISGNHDPLNAESPMLKKIGGTVVCELKSGDLILRHEPLRDAQPGEISAHLHPAARLVRRGRSIRRFCFAVSCHRVIMSAFGAYTGGLDVFHPAFDGLFHNREFDALMLGNNQVYRIAAKDLQQTSRRRK